MSQITPLHPMVLIILVLLSFIILRAALINFFTFYMMLIQENVVFNICTVFNSNIHRSKVFFWGVQGISLWLVWGTEHQNANYFITVSQWSQYIQSQMWRKLGNVGIIRLDSQTRSIWLVSLVSKRRVGLNPFEQMKERKQILTRWGDTVLRGGGGGWLAKVTHHRKPATSMLRPTGQKNRGL